MTVSLHDVHQALTELGRLRFGTMSVEDAMREIVQTTHTVFSVDGAGLMLTDVEQRLRGVAASDQRFAHLEDLQIEHGEGPCIEAFDTKQLVGTQDLEAEERWPGFSRSAVARDVRAVLASPLPYNQDAVGVVAVLSEQRRPWSAEGELGLLAFTDLAALLIASMMAGRAEFPARPAASGRPGLPAGHRAGQGRADGHEGHLGAGRLRAAPGPGQGRAPQAAGGLRRDRGRRRPLSRGPLCRGPLNPAR